MLIFPLPPKCLLLNPFYIIWQSRHRLVSLKNDDVFIWFFTFLFICLSLVLERNCLIHFLDLVTPLNIDIFSITNKETVIQTFQMTFPNVTKQINSQNWNTRHISLHFTLFCKHSKEYYLFEKYTTIKKDFWI